MNLNKIYINTIPLVIAIAFVTSLLLTSSIELSFAKMDNENKHDEKDFKKDNSFTLDRSKLTIHVKHSNLKYNQKPQSKFN